MHLVMRWPGFFAQTRQTTRPQAADPVPRTHCCPGEGYRVGSLTRPRPRWPSAAAAIQPPELGQTCWQLIQPPEQMIQLPARIPPEQCRGVEAHGDPHGQLLHVLRRRR